MLGIVVTHSVFLFIFKGNRIRRWPWPKRPQEASINEDVEWTLWEGVRDALEWRRRTLGKLNHLLI